MRCAIVGLTGGIACGKTLVTGMFETLGIRVFDADHIARELVQPGQTALQEIISVFGSPILNPDGTLARTRLREKIFTSTIVRKKLEGILHPRIYAHMQHQAAQLKNITYCIFSVPLLIETQKIDLVDRLLVIDCNPDIQIQRLQQRDQIDIGAVQKILAAQSDRQTRLAYANDVIQNNSTPFELNQQVENLHRYYLGLFGKQQS